MADPAPKTQSWSARENKHKRTGMHLIVSGLVEVDATNKEALLTEEPQVGKVLPLKLSIGNAVIEDEQFKAKQIVVWTEAYFDKTVRANNFDQVEIRWNEATVATVPVIDDREHVAQRAERMEAVNAQSEGVQAPKPTPRVIEMRIKAEEAATAREAAAKKAASKKAAPKKAKKAAKTAAKKVAAKNKPKSVGGWAKAKKAKKTAKKTTKKSTKKTAKSSTLKKLVRKLVKKLTPAKKKKKSKKR